MNNLSLFVSACLAAICALIPSRAYVRQAPFLTSYTSVIQVCRPKELPSPNTPVRFVNRLCVNTSTSFRTALNKDERAGIRDLRDLSQNACLEEHWVFLPKKTLWLEIGFAELNAGAKIDHDYLTNLIRNNEELVVYHIHPQEYLKLKECEGYDNIPQTWLALPSLEDISLMIYFSSLFYTQHPSAKVCWRICSPIGITDYALTQKGIHRYKDIRDNTFLLSYLYPSEGQVTHSKLPTFFDIAVPHKVRDLIAWANAQGQGYTRISFTPYSKRT